MLIIPWHAYAAVVDTPGGETCAAIPKFRADRSIDKLLREGLFDTNCYLSDRLHFGVN